MAEHCLHCEQAPRENYLRLCNRCAAQRSIRRLYRKAINWTPERDARIQALVEKVKRGEPLFEDTTSHEKASSSSAAAAV
jgi:hypothetical protein